MIDISQREKEVIELLRNLSGESEERIQNILLALMSYALMQYAEGEEIVVPLFGDFKIIYRGDKIIENKREAQLDSFFSPSNILRKNIGQYEDFKNDKGNLSDIEIVKYHKNGIENIIKYNLNK